MTAKAQEDLQSLHKFCFLCTVSYITQSSVKQIGVINCGNFMRKVVLMAWCSRKKRVGMARTVPIGGSSHERNCAAEPFFAPDSAWLWITLALLWDRSEDQRFQERFDKESGARQSLLLMIILSLRTPFARFPFLFSNNIPASLSPFLFAGCGSRSRNAHDGNPERIHGSRREEMTQALCRLLHIWLVFLFSLTIMSAFQLVQFATLNQIVLSLGVCIAF